MNDPIFGFAQLKSDPKLSSLILKLIKVKNEVANSFCSFFNYYQAFYYWSLLSCADLNNNLVFVEFQRVTPRWNIYSFITVCNVRQNLLVKKIVLYTCFDLMYQFHSMIFLKIFNREIGKSWPEDILRKRVKRTFLFQWWTQNFGKWPRFVWSSIKSRNRIFRHHIFTLEGFQLEVQCTHAPMCSVFIYVSKLPGPKPYESDTVMVHRWIYLCSMTVE